MRACLLCNPGRVQNWFPEVFDEFKVVSVMDLLEEYIKSGRIKLNTISITKLTTVHDPCNYVRKSDGLR